MADVPAARWRFTEAGKAAKRAHVSVFTVWEAFTGIDLADGLLDFNGNERLVLRRLREADANTVLDMSGPIAILGIGDRGDSPSEARRYFELYGRFPDAGTQTCDAEVVCDGVKIDTAVTSRSQGQINVAIEMPADERCCVFRVRRSSDNARSNEFGPRPVVPMQRVR